MNVHILGLLLEKSTTTKSVLFQDSAVNFARSAKMANQSLMRLCDYLNRAGGRVGGTRRK